MEFGENESIIEPIIEPLINDPINIATASIAWVCVLGTLYNNKIQGGPRYIPVRVHDSPEDNYDCPELDNINPGQLPFVNLVFFRDFDGQPLGYFRMTTDLPVMLELIEQLHASIMINQVIVDRLYLLSEENYITYYDSSINQLNTALLDDIDYLRKLESTYLKFYNFTPPYTRKPMYRIEE